MRTRTIDMVLVKCSEFLKLWISAFSAKHRDMTVITCSCELREEELMIELLFSRQKSAKEGFSSSFES
jgi:hypothetical protein